MRGANRLRSTGSRPFKQARPFCHGFGPRFSVYTRHSPTQRPRVALLCGPGTSPHDAILAYSNRLAAALRSNGSVDAAVLRLAAPGRWLQEGDQRLELGAPLGFDGYLLQYNPFSFGRWGFAPGLPMAWYRVRKRTRKRALKVVTVH